MELASSPSTTASFEENTTTSTRFFFNPKKLFVTDMELDFTVVALDSIPTRSTVVASIDETSKVLPVAFDIQGKEIISQKKQNASKTTATGGRKSCTKVTPSKSRSIVDVNYEPLEINSSKRVAVGSTLQIVHHPRGGIKMMGAGSAVQIVQSGYNREIDSLGYNQANQFVLYNFDTDFGSSGSPIFMHGELVAIHHQRSPANKANRGVLMSAIRPKLLSLWSSSSSSSFSATSLKGGSVGGEVPCELKKNYAASSFNDLDPSTTLYVNPGPRSFTNGLKEAKRRKSKDIVFKKGVHEGTAQQDAYGNPVNYGVLDFGPINVHGEGVDATIIVGGIQIMGNKREGEWSLIVCRKVLSACMFYGEKHCTYTVFLLSISLLFVFYFSCSRRKNINIVSFHITELLDAWCFWLWRDAVFLRRASN